MAKRDITTTPFDEFLTYLSLCVVTDAQIVDWIKKHATLKQERWLQLVRMLDLTKGDRELSPVLADALKPLRGLRAA